jgi:hypothetical protein
LDSSFNNGRAPGAPPVTSEATAPTPVTATGVADQAAPLVTPAAKSPATERFLSCRWRKAPSEENTLPEHCTHRDVLPMAGTHSFAPDSWCADCGFYKAKRTPRKRTEDSPSQDSWGRW